MLTVSRFITHGGSPSAFSAQPTRPGWSEMWGERTPGRVKYPARAQSRRTYESFFINLATGNMPLVVQMAASDVPTVFSPAFWAALVSRSTVGMIHIVPAGAYCCCKETPQSDAPATTSQSLFMSSQCTPPRAQRKHAGGFKPWRTNSTFTWIINHSTLCLTWRLCMQHFHPVFIHIHSGQASFLWRSLPHTPLIFPPPLFANSVKGV